MKEDSGFYVWDADGDPSTAEWSDAANPQAAVLEFLSGAGGGVLKVVVVGVGYGWIETYSAHHSAPRVEKIK